MAGQGGVGRSQGKKKKKNSFTECYWNSPVIWSKNVQSDQNPLPGSTSQATCLLKAKHKATCGYAFGLKSPKTV